MAWTTSLGDEIPAVWERLLDGETGLTPVPCALKLRNELAGAVATVSAQLPAAERLHTMARNTAGRAAEEAGSDGDTAFVVGTSFGSFLEDDPPEANAHLWADRLARELGLCQPAVVVSTACSAGTDAIAIGAEMVRAGVARRCLCGGVDVLTVAKRLNHSALGTMSPSTLRAFDVRHDGTLLGEGAAFLVLERADDAAAAPLAFVRGCGGANDATGMTAPDEAGGAVCLAIRRSLADAGIRADDVGCVNAHASGTVLNDMTERAALGDVFAGRGKPVVFGTKGNFGHSLGATGAIETVALILALREGCVPPVYGLERPDPEFPLPLAAGRPVACDARFGVNVTLGFGGLDTSLVVEGCR
jgi:3-oxoacyl-[acyl-carrier-protein] synthase II